MVVGCIISAPARDHARYIKGRREMPLRPPTEATREDGIFEALWRTVPNPHERGKHKNALDIRGDVKACRQESLCKKGDESASEDLETGPRHTFKPTGRQETEGGDRGDGYGVTTGRRATKS